MLEQAACQMGTRLPGKGCAGIIIVQIHQENTVMAQVCDVCGKGPQFGNRVSHAHNVTKRRWNVNLQSVRALVNGAGRRLRVCTACLRSGKVQKAA